MKKLQELFDTALKGLLAQDGPSKGRDGGCCYQTGERRCAVGWLLTEEELATLRRKRLNSKGLYLLDDKNAMPASIADVYKDKTGQTLLTTLQEIHDGFVSNPRAGEWKTYIKEAFKVVATRTGLEYKELT